MKHYWLANRSALRAILRGCSPFAFALGSLLLLGSEIGEVDDAYAQGVPPYVSSGALSMGSSSSRSTVELL